MQNESNSTAHNQDEIAKLEADIREAIAHGGDVKETVRQLTLKAMHAKKLGPRVAWPDCSRCDARRP